MEKDELLQNVFNALLASGVLQSELLREVQRVLKGLSVAEHRKLHDVVVALLDNENDEF